jgi:hypothetical protein
LPASNAKSRKKNPALALGVEDDRLFRMVFMPTYLRWIGTQANPWFIPDDLATETLQIIWDAIYPAVPWTVRPSDHIFDHVRFSVSLFSIGEAAWSGT